MREKIIDVSKLGDEGYIDSPEYKEGLENSVSGVTIFTAPEPEEGHASTQASNHFIVYYDAFDCVERSGEVGRDEIYWTSSAAAGKQFPLALEDTYSYPLGILHHANKNLG